MFKVPAGVTTTVARSQVVSFTMPLVWVKFSLFIKNPDCAINYEAYTEPLHYTTWLLILHSLASFSFSINPVSQYLLRWEFILNKCLSISMYYLLNNYSYGEKDPEYKEFTLIKSIIFVIGSLTVRGWSVTPTTNAARVAFAM